MSATRAACAALLLLLAACAAPPRPPAQGWSGKLGYRVEAGVAQRAQAGSALFELEGDANAGRILLSSPLGSTLAEARWGTEGLSLFDGNERLQRFGSLEELGAALGERLQGAPLPLAALFDWLQDRPWPQAPHETRGQGFAQLGWTVIRQAERLRLERAADGGHGAMTLTLILTP